MVNKSFYHYEYYFALIMFFNLVVLDINIATPAFFWLVFPSIPQFTIFPIFPQTLSPGISIYTQDILRCHFLLLFTSQISPSFLLFLSSIVDLF